MNRRILPFSLVVCGAILAYACSSKDSTSDPVPTPVPEGGGTDGAKPDDDAGTNPDGSKTDSSIPPTGNPIEGIGNPTEVAILTNIYTEGPVWRTDGLYFSTYGTTGSFVKLTPPNTTTAVRAVVNAGSYPLGNAWDPKTNTFVSCEVLDGVSGGSLVRTPAVGGVGTPIPLGFDAGGGAFDSPNDLVVRKDGTIYVTDPGYQGQPVINHLWRVKPTTNEIFETALPGRPNGIALSPDEKTLYVSFTDPPAPAVPNIMKYPLAVADGAIGAGTVFTNVGAGTSLDGLAVDTSGNVYAAVKNGVDVFKADGSGKWGHITTTKIVNGVAFGGADKKTLYMTSNTGLLQVNVKIAGID